MNNSLPTALSITRKDQEQLLITELRSRTAAPQCTQVAPQAVEISSVSLEELTQTPLFFSAQLLPSPVRVEAASITQWAQQLYGLLATELGEPVHRWVLHIFDPLSAETGKRYARPDRVREALLELLKQRRRSLLRALGDTPSDDTILVQVALVSATHGYLSVATPQMQHQCRAALSLNVAGYLDVPDDKAPPSRAFKKLREALSRFALPLKRGETAVDLGATPGGWTYVLLQEGLRVTAIDRSPLDPTLMNKRGVDWIQGNALTWQPPKPVDWLVCDVITTPENTLSILKRWISGRWCKKFCVTVKFKGAPEVSTLARINEFLSSSTEWFDGKQLTHNKNEVTVVGVVAS
jgi:23S rRNA (cytidine2498-2'-O)-methyltransferase